VVLNFRYWIGTVKVNYAFTVLTGNS